MSNPTRAACRANQCPLFGSKWVVPAIWLQIHVRESPCMFSSQSSTNLSQHLQSSANIQSETIRCTTVAIKCKHSVRSNLVRSNQVQNQFDGCNQTIGELASSNNQTAISTLKQRSKANFVLITCCLWTTGGVKRESVEALEAEQSPCLTAKRTTATQKLNLKQTLAREGAIKFCASHRGRDNLELQAQASARGLPKHSWNRPANKQCSNNRSGAQFHGIKLSKTVVRITFISRTW